MKLSIQDCTNEDQEYLVEKLVDYNLSKVQSEQSELFMDLIRKIEKDEKIIAGIIDFQAKEFYEKQGYEVFGQLDNCPRNHTRYYVKKYF